MKTIKEERRLGKFEMSDDFLWNTDIGDLSDMMKNFILMNIKSDLSTRKVEYGGYCKFFRAIEEDEVLPLYKISVHTIEGFYSHITVEEIDER